LAEVCTGLNRPEKAGPLYQKALASFDDLLATDANRYLHLLRQAVATSLQLGSARGNRKLGDLLVEAKVIGDADRQSALQKAKRERMPIGRAIVDSGVLASDQLKIALKMQLAAKTGRVPAIYAANVLRACLHLNLSPEEILAMPELLPNT